MQWAECEKMIMKLSSLILQILKFEVRGIHWYTFIYQNLSFHQSVPLNKCSEEALSELTVISEGLLPSLASLYTLIHGMVTPA